MTTTLSLSRTRGDTWPIRMTFTNPDGTPMDLTNKHVILTANTEEDPIDTTNQVFQIVGTITDALLGKVEFAPTADDADNVGLFYFDVEVSDGLLSWSWSAAAGIADNPYDLEADDILYRKTAANDTILYQEVDGVPVMRIKNDVVAQSWKRTLVFRGAPRLSPQLGIRWSGSAYFDGNSWLGFDIHGDGGGSYWFSYISCETGDYSVTIQGWAGYPLQTTYPNVTGPQRAWTAPGWVQFVGEVHSDGTYRMKAWQPSTESVPSSWDVEIADMNLSPLERMTLMLQPVPADLANAMDIAWIRFEEFK